MQSGILSTKCPKILLLKKGPNGTLSTRENAPADLYQTSSKPNFGNMDTKSNFGLFCHFKPQLATLGVMGAYLYFGLNWLLKPLFAQVIKCPIYWVELSKNLIKHNKRCLFEIKKVMSNNGIKYFLRHLFFPKPWQSYWGIHHALYPSQPFS